MEPGGILALVDTIQVDFVVIVGVAYLLYDKLKSKQVK